MMDLDVEEMVSAVKIIYLDAEVSIEKKMVALVFEIDGGGIYTAMTLINQDTMVLLQIVVLGFEIWYLETVVFSLVLCLIDIVTRNEYLWMLYQKFLQFYWYYPYSNLQDQYYTLELRQVLLVPQTDYYFPQSKYHVECNMLIFYSRFYRQVHPSVL